jgi:hypothetical protein
MTDFMSNDQIISAAKSDIDNKIDRGIFYGDQAPNDDGAHGGDWENFFTITSLYAQWSKDQASAEEELWKMYEEDYPQFFMNEVTS